MGQPLGHPPLDASGRYGDDLYRERVAQRLPQQIGEPANQAVGALGTVDVQHHPHPLLPTPGPYSRINDL